MRIRQSVDMAVLRNENLLVVSAVAERLGLALRQHGHEVFFDQQSLPAGDSFDRQIREAIEDSDLMVVLLSGEFLDANSYTLTEVELAR